MNTVEGYIHAEMFSLILPLAMGYFAIRVVTGATVGAEERGYLDTTLALPVTRTVLLAGSYVVAAVACAAIMALTGAMTFIVGRVAGTDISLRLVTAGVMGVWPLAMLFAGVAALASGALHSARIVTGVAVGALVAMPAASREDWTRSGGYHRSATTGHPCVMESTRRHSSACQRSDSCS